MVLNERYTLSHLIGRGGSATVYRGVDRKLGSPVAVKVLHPELARDITRRRRFQQEAVLSASLHHENLVTVTDIGADDGPGDEQRIYFVMPLIDGETLRDLVMAGPIHWLRCVELTRQIFQAVAVLHQNGAIHRDLKLTNCMVVTRSDGSDWLRLLDFGLAKVVRESSFAQPVDTTSSGIMGTDTYLAPERIVTKTADERADIYSVGIMLYELLTRRPPFVGNQYEVLHGHVSQPPPDLRKRCKGRDIPDSLVAFVQRCLVKNPNDRYQDAHTCISELDRVLAYDGFGQRTVAGFIQAGAQAARAGLTAFVGRDFKQAAACASDAARADPSWRPLEQLLAQAISEASAESQTPVAGSGSEAQPHSVALFKAGEMPVVKSQHQGIKDEQEAAL